MIRSLLFLSASFLLASASLAQWVGGGSSGTTIHHQACAFHEVDTGLFVYGANDPGQGAGGIIITWSGLVGSGGNIWSTSPGNLEDIDVRMGSNGRPIYLAAGHKQYNQSMAVYQYLAGGSAFDFESVITGSGRYYRAVRMRSDIVAFAAGGDALGNGIIDMSTDTGFTWMNIAVLPGQPVSRLHFVDDQLGFAACGGYRRLFNNGVQLVDSGAIYRTTDGGLTWLQVHADPDNGFSDVAFNSSLQGVASRNDGAILRTTDGGNTWTPATVNHPGPYIMTSVTFRPDGNGFASCYRADGTAGFILFSDDGGATWDFNFSTAGLNHSRRIYDMYFYDNAHGYALTHIRPLRSNGLVTEIAEADAAAFDLYPNPTEGAVTLTLEGAGPADVEVLDAVGRLVWTGRTSGGGSFPLPVDGLPAGSYVVRVRSGSTVTSRTLVRTQ